MNVGTLVFCDKIPFKILPGLVCYGRMLDDHLSIAFVTASEKVYIYNPKFYHSAEGNTNILSQDFIKCSTIHSVYAVDTGKFKQISDDNDLLIIGSKMLKNDGVNTVVYQHFEQQHLQQYKNSDVILVGGNCTLSALNYSGSELFWTVTGDTISALTCLSYENADEYFNDIVVGSEDYIIRVFRGDSFCHEISETDVICKLVSLGGEYFGYGLKNGTIGVYNRTSRIWRIKSKNKPICFSGYDINHDGYAELICGWNSGKVDARLRSNGVVVFKIQLGACIAGLTVGDYYGFSNVLLVCTVEGDINCYFLLEQSKDRSNCQSSEDILRQLISKRQNLRLEIQRYNENMRLEQLSKTEIRQANFNIIKANTELQTSLEVSKNSPCVNLKVQTNNNTPLRCVILFAEGIFQGESHVIHPPTNVPYATSYTIEIRPPKDVPVDVFIKAYGVPIHRNPDEDSYYLLKSTQVLPQFSLYRLLSLDPRTDHPDDLERLQSGVFFKVYERPQRLAIWLNHNFILGAKISIDEQSPLSVLFEELRPISALTSAEHNTLNRNSHVRDFQEQRNFKHLLYITMTNEGEITIKTENIELASNLVQSISRHLSITELPSTCDFPKVLNTLEELIEMSSAYSSTQQQVSVDMVSKTDTVKHLIVRAEDYRLNGNWNLLKKTFQQLSNANTDILSNYYSRVTDYEASMNCLKRIHQIIEYVSSLRVGKYKTTIITMCHNALKENNIGTLKKIIRTGSN
ncbi:unnamed protein product [Heterobilharzia americana]|nr:unnamed protein product [Heterobilharzia americana]